MGRRVIFIQHFLFPIFFPIFLGKERGGGVEKSWAQGENNLAHHFLSPKIIPTKHPSHLKYLLFSLPHFSSSFFFHFIQTDHKATLSKCTKRIYEFLTT